MLIKSQEDVRVGDRIEITNRLYTSRHVGVVTHVFADSMRVVIKESTNSNIIGKESIILYDMAGREIRKLSIQLDLFGD